MKQSALRKQRDIIGISRGEIEIVQDSDHAIALPRQRACVLEYKMLMRDIQSCLRFIEQHPGRLVMLLPHLCKYARQLHALLFATGQIQIVAST